MPESPPVLHRSATADIRATGGDGSRTVELSFSSEAAVRRWFGYEVLGHGPGEVDLSRLENGAAVLVNHDTGSHVGVVEKAWVEGDRGKARVRLGKSARASEVLQDLNDGILRHVSVGYFVERMEPAGEQDGIEVFRVSWQPFELSFVSIPADTSVGVGRETESTIQHFREYFHMNDRTTAGEARRTLSLNGGDDSGAAAERARVSELLKVGETYGHPELARQAIEKGHDLHWLNKAILERQTGGQVIRAEDPSIGMSRSEVHRFSWCKLFLALHEPEKYSRDAAFELEACRAAADHLKRDPKGVVVPYDVMAARRDLNVGTAGDGGNLVATELLASSFIEKLENRLALVQAGATMLPGLTGNIAIPRQTGGVSTFWLAENGAPTESSATFDQVAMSPKTVGAYSEISRRLLLQSSIGIEAFVQAELATRLALAIDLAGIDGTGASNQPTGVLNYTGLQIVGGDTNGKAFTWDDIVNLETAVAADNADVGRLAYLMNANGRGYAKRSFIDAGSGERIWDSRAGGNPVNGYRTVVSNQVPSDLTKGTGTGLSAVLFGDWSALLMGMWGGLDLQVNPYSLDTKGAIRVTAFQDIDIEIQHIESFAAINDAITT